MLGVIAAYLIGRWDADRAHDTPPPSAPCRPTTSTYDVPTVAERRAAREAQAAGNRALSTVSQPEPRELSSEADQRAWRIVLPIMGVLAVVVALLA
jgi:hypothetical protein